MPGKGLGSALGIEQVEYSPNAIRLVINAYPGNLLAMSMNWQIRLLGDPLDLHELSKSLDSPDLSIKKDDEDYYLKSSRFYPIQQESDIRVKADEILTLINGSLKLARNSQKSLEVGHIVRIRDNGTKEIFDHFIETINLGDSVRIVVEHENGSVEEARPADPIKEWLAIAQTNENVSKALRYLSKGDDNWVRLYHIYEIIHEDLGGKKGIVDKGYASKTALKRFTRSANSASVAGEAARHAVERTTPPTQPMSLSEARTWIKGILYSWIQDKRI